MYFTTITNKYGLKVVEHVAGDGQADFVASSGLAWVEVDEEITMPATGDYWHNEELIKLDSDKYDTVIAPILKDARDVENVTIQAKHDELEAEKARLLAEHEEGAGDYVAPDADPAVLDLAEQKIIAKQAKKPIYIPIREQDEIPPYTQATLDLYTEMLADTKRMIAGIKCSQGGHYFTNQLLRKVFENKENYSLIEIKEKNLPYTLINKAHLRSIA